MQVVRAFTGALGASGFAVAEEGDGAGEDEAMMDAGATEHTVLREYVIASLRSFLRRYHTQAAELEAEIEGVLDGADAQVRELVEAQLQL